MRKHNKFTPDGAVPVFLKTNVERWASKLNDYQISVSHGDDHKLLWEDLTAALGISTVAFNTCRKRGLMRNLSIGALRKDIETLLSVAAVKADKSPKEIENNPAPALAVVEVIQEMPAPRIQVKTEMELFEAAKQRAKSAAKEAYRDSLIESADEARERGDDILEVMLLREFAAKEHILNGLG